MALTVAMLVNDRLLLPCLCREIADELASLRKQLLADCGIEMALARPTPGEASPDLAGGVALELGIGHYEQGEALLTRQPMREGAAPGASDEGAFETLFCGSRSNCSVAHAVLAPARGFHPAEVQPFRFRDWLWALSGDLREKPGFDRQALAIPPYIASNIRTWKPAEVAFHLFLAFLHRTSTLETLYWDRGGTRRALAAAVSLIDSLFVAGDDGDPASYSIVTTNGEVILAVGIRRPLFLRTVEGIAECRQCADKVALGRAAEGARRHDHVRAVLVADLRPAEPAAVRWKPLEPGEVLEVDGALGIEYGDLDYQSGRGRS
jgi:hypothetical protein